MEDDKDMKIYEDLLDALNSGERAVMLTSLEKGIYIRKLLCTEQNMHNSGLTEDAAGAVIDSMKDGNPKLVQVSDDRPFLMEPYFPKPRLYIFGGGHIALPLAEFAVKTGFSITVVDDRPAFANRERFPMAEKVICESFDKSFEQLNLNKSTFVVIVTYGHTHDTDCLRRVLKYDTAYVGMIGSRRRVKIVMDQLAEEGYDIEKLKKVNSPIGLEIGAVTPEEIAISIISQVISYRRLAGYGDGSSKVKLNWPDFDSDVLDELASHEDSPKAMVTVISTKGSVPRKAGAKMLVYPYGKIIGSIGGGCSERAAINDARDVIRSGGYRLQTVDLTGIDSDEEGMACGGIMNVLIESLGSNED